MSFITNADELREFVRSQQRDEAMRARVVRLLSRV